MRCCANARYAETFGLHRDLRLRRGGRSRSSRAWTRGSSGGSSRAGEGDARDPERRRPRGDDAIRSLAVLSIELLGITELFVIHHGCGCGRSEADARCSGRTCARPGRSTGSRSRTARQSSTGTSPASAPTRSCRVASRSTGSYSRSSGGSWSRCPRQPRRPRPGLSKCVTRRHRARSFALQSSSADLEREEQRRRRRRVVARSAPVPRGEGAACRLHARILTEAGQRDERPRRATGTSSRAGPAQGTDARGERRR